MDHHADIVVVGAGAAGLMAAIWAGRTNPAARIIALDGAKHLGAKILVAGGGRCNVTHDIVDESAYSGSSRQAIKKVLRSFSVERTIDFFRELNVELKREDTGKLFPTTDSARTVLDALIRAASNAGVVTQRERRVESIELTDTGFRTRGPWGELASARVILATGGKSLPKSGSDGTGYTLAASLGHTITPRVFPALVPLIIEPPTHFIRVLSGLTLPTTLEVRSSTGKKLVSFTDSTLCTHFGLSGPPALDISRHWTSARFDDPGATLIINWVPGLTFDQAERELVELGPKQVGKWISSKVPERLWRSGRAAANVDPSTTGAKLSRDARRALVRVVVEMPVPVVGDRGFTHAEVTAGGVPLTEVNLATMESRVRAGLHLCGEICDVDGRIGGYNFQWAWASGYLAGCGAAKAEPTAP